MKFDGQKIFYKTKDLQCEIGPKHGSNAESHAHDDDFQIEVLFEGSMVALDKSGANRVAPASISVFNPSDPHRTDYEQSNSLFFFASKNFVNSYTLETFGISNPIFDSKESCDFLLPREILFNDIFQLGKCGPRNQLVEPPTDERSKLLDLLREDKSLSLFRSLVNNLVIGQGLAKKPGELNYHEALIRRSIEFLNDNYRDQIDIERLASVSGLSTFHFSRVFKKVTGKSPYKYLIEIRLRKAKELRKRQPEMNLAHLAALCGFKDEKKLLYHLGL